MAPKKNMASKKQKKTTTNTSREQRPFESSRFIGDEQENIFRELACRHIWDEKRFIINDEGDHKMLVCLLELRKWGTLINSYKNQNYDVIHEFDSNALPSEGDPFSFTTMVRGINIHFNREETNKYMGNPHTLTEGALCLYARSQ